MIKLGFFLYIHGMKSSNSQKKRGTDIVPQMQLVSSVPQEHTDICNRLPLLCLNGCEKSDIPREEVTVQFAVK